MLGILFSFTSHLTPLARDRAEKISSSNEILFLGLDLKTGGCLKLDDAEIGTVSLPLMSSYFSNANGIN